MITLNELAYNIKNLAYGGDTSLENSIDIRQIKHWIHYHRSKLIVDNMSKGIMDNTNLYQSIALSAFNTTNQQIIDYVNAWEDYKKKKTTTNPLLGISNVDWLLDFPKRNEQGELNGEFLGVSALNSPDSDAWRSGARRGQYGVRKTSTKRNKGDFRNYGGMSFHIPRIILPGSTKQPTANVRLYRYTHMPDDTPIVDNDGTLEVDTTSNQGGGWAADQIPVMYSASHLGGRELSHNKFTNNEVLWYIKNRNEKDVNGYGGSQYIALQNLETAPHYFGDKHTPGSEKILWKYRAYLRAVFENPTETRKKGLSGYMWYQDENAKWDDSKSPYPIPMEYVSDLIQRVLQIEVQTSLKTHPDVLVDGMDDTVNKNMNSGAQVQR